MPDRVVFIRRRVMMMGGVDLQKASNPARQGVGRGHLGPRQEEEDGAGTAVEGTRHRGEDRQVRGQGPGASQVDGFSMSPSFRPTRC